MPNGHCWIKEARGETGRESAGVKMHDGHKSQVSQQKNDAMK